MAEQQPQQPKNPDPEPQGIPDFVCYTCGNPDVTDLRRLCCVSSYRSWLALTSAEVP